jgi:hypothetical protein
LFVLITSLLLHLVDAGRYSLNRKTLGKRFMHLTNYAVNKKSKDFVSNENPEHTGTGSKWFVQLWRVGSELSACLPACSLTSGVRRGLRALRRYFLQEGMSQQTLDATFERIEDVLIKTIISIESYVCSEVSRLGLNRCVRA